MSHFLQAILQIRWTKKNLQNDHLYTLSVLYIPLHVCICNLCDRCLYACSIIIIKLMRKETQMNTSIWDDHKKKWRDVMWIILWCSLWILEKQLNLELKNQITFYSFSGKWSNRYSIFIVKTKRYVKILTKKEHSFIFILLNR